MAATPSNGSGAGAGAGGGNPQVSASLLHKMSKKIAQLTKVIYLLNTKADEHEYNIECLEEAYEADIDAILRSVLVSLCHC